MVCNQLYWNVALYCIWWNIPRWCNSFSFTYKIESLINITCIWWFSFWTDQIRYFRLLWCKLSLFTKFCSIIINVEWSWYFCLIIFIIYIILHRYVRYSNRKFKLKSCLRTAYCSSILWIGEKFKRSFLWFNRQKLN